MDWNEGSVNADESVFIPGKLILYPNWPNPFNPTTEIAFELPENGPVSIAIYNIEGKIVLCEVEYRAAGPHFFRFDGSDLPSGTYFCRISASDQIAERKIVLLK